MSRGSLVYSEFFTTAFENNNTVFVKTRITSVVGKVKDIYADGVSIQHESTNRLYALKFEDIYHAEMK